MEDKKINIRNLDYDALVSLILEMNEPKFRAKQIYEWLWIKNCSSFQHMSNLGKGLQSKLEDGFYIDAISLSDEQIVESGIRAARNFGRGVAFCGVKCGSPMKPQLWTPISYEWDNSKWAKEVHDPYGKNMGWGSKSKV